MPAARRPRLTPAIADIRRAVRELLISVVSRPDSVQNDGDSSRNAGRPGTSAGASAKKSVVLVGLSGGADSLALAAATAFEAPRAGIRAGAVIVDHGLQTGSADVAARAAEQASALGLAPVLVRRVVVPLAGPGAVEPGRVHPSGRLDPVLGADGDQMDALAGLETGGARAGAGRPGPNEGPEGAARAARYSAFDDAMREVGASHVLLAHTLDDQAETVLLGLARGSGATSLHGMSPVNGPYLRPLLGIRRAMTRQFCTDAGLTPWDDPQNLDTRFARVRVRQTVLPTLEAQLGPGIAEALARTALQLREDDDALDAMIRETIEDICEPAEAGIAVSVGALEANPPALRHRIIRYVVASEFGIGLERTHVEAVARLITHWHGQKALDLPGVRVARHAGMLVFQANTPA